MTPFSIKLRHLRVARGQRQKVTAILLGVDPSNFCAIENGHRPPPRNANFFKKLKTALDLSDDELQDLLVLAEATRQLGPAVSGASPDQIKVALRFSERLPDLRPSELRAIQAILDLREESSTSSKRCLELNAT